MQNGVGGALHRFGSQFSGHRAKQGQQFGGIASEVLMVLSNWLSFGLPGWPSLGNGLIGPCFIFTPDLQSQPFSLQVRSLNDRFFSCVKGSWLCSTVPSLRLRKVVPVLHQVRLCCQP
jgi:hypothetical protein